MRELVEADHGPKTVEADFKGWAKLLDELPLGLFISSEKGELKYVNKFLSGLLKKEGGHWCSEKGGLSRQIFRQIEDCLTSGKPSRTSLKNFDQSDLTIRVFPFTGEAGACHGVGGVVEICSSVENLQTSLEKKVNELSIICELGKVLRSTLNLEETLQIILIGVTARQGLGFNRAFLLLLNQDGRVLEGKMAIGPSNQEEAKRIWDSLSIQEQSLEEVLQSYKDALSERDILVNRIVTKLKVSLSDQENPLVRSMSSKKAFNLTRGEGEDQKLFDLLQTDQFAVTPLISKDKVLGVLVADNLITRRHIEDEDVKLLSICAHHASAALESSQLYQNLEEKVKKLAEANKKIAENTQRLVKIERLLVLGQITSQVAHELRNPMTVIGGFAHSILKKMDAGNPDYEYIKIIAKETERMENVLNNVLNFSKTDRSNLERINLNELVEQTLDMMESEIDSTRISVIKNPSPDLSPVMANPDLIRQALLNIFRNAIWAMPRGGILSVSIRQKEKLAKIEIKDTGFGISPEHRGSIFEAFFTTKPDACGLGLTVSSEIIKNHGGKIGVDSVEGKGATFYVELPVAEDTKPGEPVRS
jgi:signal transduction histidine kinase